MASYSDSEIQAIAGWLRDGLSASRIAAAFSARRGAPVSRNAIIGIVHRNAMLGAIGFANGKGLPGDHTALAKAGRTAKVERKGAGKMQGATSRGGAASSPVVPGKSAGRLKRNLPPARSRPVRREAGVLVADGQTYRFEPPVQPRGPIGRQPHGVAMRFIDCLFDRCRAPLDLTLEEDPQSERPGQDMLCCGMRTRALKSYCSYHQGRFQRRVCQ
ncbi:GcrA cell cycle regulator [Mesorhizobium sp. B2-3-4]|uniref:GcrA cell cycle regulator n=1 Tax=Mesorhizobium sp. B2-3-4 TaxID=2589959 RepID=UPI0011292E9B|nr:GcrA cell cycle regulator [Mesorhizobium sp. B2-3-4]TPM28247.1 GcrA cell cycle regulator [Mesorhizobium sp. B2-3-4]